VSKFFRVVAQQPAHAARTERHSRRLAQGLPEASNRERWPLRTTGKTECQTFYAARVPQFTRENGSRRKAFAVGMVGTGVTSGRRKRFGSWSLVYGLWGLGFGGSTGTATAACREMAVPDLAQRGKI
jgi:hypothetical protein